MMMSWCDMQRSQGGSVEPQLGGDDVLRILESAEEIMQPTPLGPNGVESLVQEVCFTDNPWHNDETLAKLLHPLFDSSRLKKKMCEPLMKKQGVSSTSFKAEMGSFLDHKNGQDAADGSRFRRYQADQWSERFQELVIFRQQNWHCLVPHDFPVNQQLAQWVKRQRYQHKLKQMSRHSTLADEREAALEEMGFIWDSHKAAWEERFLSLYDFYKKQEGHSNVPSNFPDRTLAIWVKCQRRQYKLYTRGKRSTMTAERIYQLEQLGFVWNPRNL
jgi:hypothetical protein